MELCQLIVLKQENIINDRMEVRWKWLMGQPKGLGANHSKKVTLEKK
jgi:hypothetical protein